MLARGASSDESSSKSSSLHETKVATPATAPPGVRRGFDGAPEHGAPGLAPAVQRAAAAAPAGIVVVAIVVAGKFFTAVVVVIVGLCAARARHPAGNLVRVAQSYLQKGHQRAQTAADDPERNGPVRVATSV
jgi:hypothetical protein